MHDPELLILDEPTVGVDPLLRQSIWNHLVQITKDGNKTVIITTHYIEEARQAHTVSNHKLNVTSYVKYQGICVLEAEYLP
jgi:ABC-type multidrug transport system ATPase subunit